MQLSTTPTTEGEQPGMGAILGGLTGTGAGLFAAQVLTVVLGFSFSSAEYIGLIATGLSVGCMLCGLAGAKLENALTRGLPKDEFYYYKNQLVYGRSVIVVITERWKQLHYARMSLEGSGVEVLNPARKVRSIGLRPGKRAVISNQ